MKNFIKLTDPFSGQIFFFNPAYIMMIQPRNDDGGGSTVYLMGGPSRSVKETPDEIKKLIDKNDRYTLINTENK